MPRVASKAQWAKFWQLEKEGKMSREEVEKRIDGVDYKKLPRRLKRAKSFKRGVRGK